MGARALQTAPGHRGPSEIILLQMHPSKLHIVEVLE